MYRRRQLQSGKPLRITRPWEARAEQIIVAAGIAAGVTDWHPDMRFAVGRERARISLAALLIESATTYLWTMRAWDLMRSAPPLPPHVVSDDILPFPVMYWSLETALSVSTPDGPSGLDWFTLREQPGRSGVEVIYNTQPDEPAQDPRDVSDNPTQPNVLRGGILKYKSKWPDDFSEAEQVFAEPVLKMLAFLHSPYIAVGAESLDRHDRRRLARSGLSLQEQEWTANVVKLRNEQWQVGYGASGTGPDRAHRWWVAGHFRAQWFPSKQSHHVIFIAPHLKGPEGRPVLEKVYHVVR